MSSTFDLKTLNLPAGTYEVLVKAKGTYWVDSEGSAISYIVEQLQLAAPVITLNGNTLTITDSNGENATSFDLYDGETLLDNYIEKTIDLSTLNLTEGNHTLTVKAKGEGFLDSEASNVVTYTVLPTLTPAPTVTLDGNTLNIFDESGLATSATVYVDDEAKATVEIARGYTVTVTVEDVPEPFYITVNGGEVNDTLGFETDKLTATYENVRYLEIDDGGMIPAAKSYTNGTYEMVDEGLTLRFTPTGDNATINVSV